MKNTLKNNKNNKNNKNTLKKKNKIDGDITNLNNNTIHLKNNIYNTKKNTIKKNRYNRSHHTKKNHKINGKLYGSLEIKKDKHYIKFNDKMIDYQYNIKLNDISKQVENQLIKQMNINDWVLELEMEDKVILEWSSKENYKLKLPKVTYFNYNQHKCRILWNIDNIEYI